MNAKKTKLKGVVNAYDFTVMRKTMTMKEIAEHYGVTVNGLYQWCERNNVIHKRLTDWELLELLKEKNTVKMIAYEYKMPISTVYQRLKRIGVKNGGKYLWR